jgi:hypothetical protein
MDSRRRELIATHESSVVAKPALDAIVVKDSERNRCLPNPPCTDESEGFEIISKASDVLDQCIAPETSPGRRGRRLSNRDAIETSDCEFTLFKTTDMA